MKARNREVLYALSKLFQRAETKRQKKVHEQAQPSAALQSPHISTQAFGSAAPAVEAGSNVAAAQTSLKQKSQKQRMEASSASDLAGAGKGELPALATPPPDQNATAAASAQEKSKKRKQRMSAPHGKATASASPSSQASRLQQADAASPPSAKPPSAQNGQSGMQSTGKKEKKSMAALVAEAAAMKAGRAAQLAGLPTPLAAGPAGQGVSTPVSAPGAAARLTESQRKKQVGMHGAPLARCR